MVASRDNFPLLAELLTEQQRLQTPAARFAEAHERGTTAGLALAREQLIPLTAPGPGERYAFEVDLDSCSGCKSCVTACHSLNGLDETETWRDVGLLLGGDARHPFQQTVTTACHHCADPACLHGCPVLAYEQDPATGIVRHLDDQCIGCQYCVLKCPYDVPKYNARLGIVRKCDMCHGRLAAGEAPACAQACPTHAIKIVTIAADTLREGVSDPVARTNPPGPVAPPRLSLARAARPSADAGNVGEPAMIEAAGADASRPVGRRPGSGAAPAFFLPGAPAGDYTRPTTRYKTQRPLPADVRAADASILRPQPAHWPLAAMLTLMPLAVGLSVAATFFRAPALPDNLVSNVTLLGQRWPVPAAAAGLRILAAAAGALGLGASVLHLGQPRRAWRIFLGWRQSWLSREAMLFGMWFALAILTLFAPVCTIPTAIAGVAGLVCSAMIYADTRRVFWRIGPTLGRFFGTGLVLTAVGLSPPAAFAALGLKLIAEAVWLFEVPSAARLARGPLRTTVLLRGAFGLAALALVATGRTMAAFPVAFCGELAERILFFRAVDAPKMPGFTA